LPLVPRRRRAARDEVIAIISPKPILTEGTLDAVATGTSTHAIVSVSSTYKIVSAIRFNDVIAAAGNNYVGSPGSVEDILRGSADDRGLPIETLGTCCLGG
jgi:hypothetical protein